jgi:flagellar hook-basal body complex protein FliE
MTIAEVAAIGVQAPLPVTQTLELQTVGQSFGTWLTQGIEGVNRALIDADAALVRAAVDGTQPPHQVMLALEDARISFHLALQVRNRVLEGYQELMRMQV